MYLLSATVSNYRGHRTTTVEFDRKGTLVCGPNESGKSTLVEAIHRALFVRHRITGELLAQMTSDFGEQPSVKVAFVADDGRTYSLDKTFGPTGRAHLSCGTDEWRNDEAEQELARLFRSEAPIQGRGAENALDKRQAHIWIWQGRSGAKPEDAIEECHADLVQELGKYGAGALVASEFDRALRDDFDEKASQRINDSGKPKARTEWARECDLLKELQAKESSAKAIIEQIEGDFTDAYQAQADIDQLEERIRLHGERLAILRKRGAEQAELTREIEKREADRKNLEDKVKGAKANLEALREAQLELADLAPRIDAAGDRLRECTAIRKAADDHVSEAETLRTEATDALNAHRAVLDAAANECNEAKLRIALDEKRQALARKIEEIEEDIRKARKYEKDVEHCYAELRKLPAITDADVARLAQLQRKAEQAESNLAALNSAQAPKFEVLHCSGTPLCNEHAIETGTEYLVQEESEIVLGKSGAIRITPQFDVEYERARSHKESSAQELAGHLGQLGIASVDEARKIWEQRSRFTNQLEALEEHAHRPSAELAKDKARHEQELQDIPVAKARAKAATQALEAAKAAHEEAMEAQQRLDKALKDAEIRCTNCRKKLKIATDACDQRQAEQSQLNQGKTRLDERIRLARTHGTEAEQATQLDALQQQHDTVVAESRRIRKELDEAPERVTPALIDQHEKNGRQLDAALMKANGALAAAKALIESKTASENPQCALEEAQARLKLCAARERALADEARACAMVAKLYGEVEDRVAAELTKPLQDAIQGYLACLFGRGVRIAIDWVDNKIGGITVDRSSTVGRHAFDKLSGGTREQVGVACRLAIAQILAAEHGGALPVILDDAFVNTDEDRISSLTPMLERASEMGLQPIVLTCHPTAYAKLPWPQHTLPPITRPRT